MSTGYAYNDTGPNTSGSPATGGGAQYPDGRANTADLIQLKMGLVPEGLSIQGVLETLTDPSVPEIGVGFDTDRDAGSGAPTIPGGQWKNSAPLGLEQFVTISRSGGHLLTWTGGSWRRTGDFPAQVDPGTNTLSTVLPATLLAPGRTAWRAVAVAGLALADASWLQGTGPVFDLAFVHAEDPCTEFACLAKVGLGLTTQGLGLNAPEWQDHVQAAILGGELDPTRAVGLVDFTAMRAQYSTPRQPATPGYHTYVYRSSLRLPEGVANSALDGPTYLGPYQPYLVRVPEHLPAAAPVVVWLHGGGQNHLMNAFNFEPSLTGPDVVTTGPFSFDALVVFPLARAPFTVPNQGYDGLAEQDVLAALADTESRFTVDRDRVVVAGQSVGGGGAFHFSELYPDRFAGAVSIAAFDTEKLPQNLGNVPVRLVDGTLDPAGNVALAEQTSAAFAALGYVDYRSFEVTKHSHEFLPGLTNCLVEAMLAAGRVTDPARVAYTSDPSLQVKDSSSGLDLSHDRAYWVSGITATSTSPAIVDAVRLTAPFRTPIATTVDAVGNNVASGADFCGPNAAVRTGDTWLERGVALRRGPAAATSNAVRVSLTGVATVVLDLAEAQVDPSVPMTVQARSDGSTQITLRDTWTRGSSVSVRTDGGAVRMIAVTAGEVRVSVEPGQHTISVAPSP